jgi:hypothetical protein
VGTILSDLSICGAAGKVATIVFDWVSSSGIAEDLQSVILDDSDSMAVPEDDNVAFEER